MTKNTGQIKFGISFDINRSGLNELKSQIASIQSLGNKDLFKLTGIKMTQNELEKIQQVAQQTEMALEAAFDPTINTLNIKQFASTLQNTVGPLSHVQAELYKLGTVGQTAFRNLSIEILTSNKYLKQTNPLLAKMRETMGNTVRWSITSGIMNSITGSIQKAYSYVKNLDSALNDIRIVTGKSSAQMKEFANSANAAAKALGANTRAYTEASLIYYQQGLSDQEVAARTETTIKAANITGQSAQTVSEQLTAVWNGYKVSAQEAELYVDKLSAVAATTAADLEELSIGMSRVASAANIMGVDIDQLNAQLATIVSVTREAPESIGTALKTVYARMSDIEAGLDTETSLGEYTAQMAQMGISALDANGHLRDMGDVIEEIGGKWKSLTREQQTSLAQTIAGTRQYSRMMALFDNWEMYERAMTTSVNAAGTLSAQQAIYLDSLEAHLEKLSTTAEDLYSSLFDEETLKDFIDGLTVAVQGIDNFVEGIGGMKGVLLGAGVVFTRVMHGQIVSSISQATENLLGFKANLQNIGAASESIIREAQTDTSDTRLQNLLTFYNQAIEKRDLLTDKEVESLDTLTKSLNTLYAQTDALEAQAKALDEAKATQLAADQQRLMNQNAVDAQLSFDSAGTLTLSAESLNSAITEEEQRLLELQGAADIASDSATNAILGALKLKKDASSKEGKDQYTEAINNIQGLENSINDLATSLTTIDPKNANELLEVLSQLNNLSEDEMVAARQVADIQKKLDTIYKNRQKTLSAFKQDINNYTKAQQENTKEMKANAAAQEKNQQAIKNAEAGMERFNSGLHLRQMISDFTTATTQVMQFGWALNSTVNLIRNWDDIWNDKDSTVLDKMMTTLSSLIPTITLLWPLIIKLGTAIKGWITGTQASAAANKEAEEQLKKTTDAEEDLTDAKKDGEKAAEDLTDAVEDETKAHNDAAAAAEREAEAIRDLNDAKKEGSLNKINTQTGSSGQLDGISSDLLSKEAKKRFEKEGLDFDKIDWDQVSDEDKQLLKKLGSKDTKNTKTERSNKLLEIARKNQKQDNALDNISELGDQAADAADAAGDVAEIADKADDVAKVADKADDVSKVAKTASKAPKGGGAGGAMGGAAGAAIIIAAIVAAISMIAWGVEQAQDEFNRVELEAQEAAKTVATLTEAYQNAAATSREMLSDFDAYKEQRDSLEKLTKGTKEYNEALEEQNQKVLELTQKYEGLAQYVDFDNGQMTLTDEGMAKVAFEQEREVNNAMSQVTAAQYYSSSASQELEIKDEANAANMGTTTLSGEDAALISGIAAGVGGVAAGLIVAGAAFSWTGVGAAVAVAGAILAAGTAITSGILLAAEEAEEQTEANIEAYKKLATGLSDEALVGDDKDLFEDEVEALLEAEGKSASEISKMTEELWETRQTLKQTKDALEQRETFGKQMVAATLQESYYSGPYQGAIEQAVAGTASDNLDWARNAVETEFGEASESNYTDYAAVRYLETMGLLTPGSSIADAKNLLNLKVSGTTFTYEQNGETITRSKGDALTTISQDLAEDETRRAIRKATETIESVFDDMELTDASKGALAEALVGGDISLDDLTLQDMQALTTSIQDLTAADQDLLASLNEDFYSDIKDVKEALDSSVEEFENSFKFQTDSGVETIEIDTSLMSLKDYRTFEEQMAVAQKAGLTEFAQIYARLSAENRGDMAAILNNINPAGTTEEITAAIQQGFAQKGGIISDTDAELLGKVAKAAAGDYSVDINKIQAQYGQLSTLVNKIFESATIGAEEYDRLSDAQKNMFGVLADGTAVLLEDAYEFYNLTRESNIEALETDLELLYASRDNIENRMKQEWEQLDDELAAFDTEIQTLQSERDSIHLMTTDEAKTSTKDSALWDYWGENKGKAKDAVLDFVEAYTAEGYTEEQAYAKLGLSGRDWLDSTTNLSSGQGYNNNRLLAAAWQYADDWLAKTDAIEGKKSSKDAHKKTRTEELENLEESLTKENAVAIADTTLQLSRTLGNNYANALNAAESSEYKDLFAEYANMDASELAELGLDSATISALKQGWEGVQNTALASQLSNLGMNMSTFASLVGPDATNKQKLDKLAELEGLNILKENIDLYDDQLDALAKYNDVLTGDALTENLKAQNQILNERIALYDSLIKQEQAIVDTNKAILINAGYSEQDLEEGNWDALIKEATLRGDTGAVNAINTILSSNSKIADYTASKQNDAILQLENLIAGFGADKKFDAQRAAEKREDFERVQQNLTGQDLINNLAKQKGALTIERNYAQARTAEAKAALQEMGWDGRSGTYETFFNKLSAEDQQKASLLWEEYITAGDEAAEKTQEIFAKNLELFETQMDQALEPFEKAAEYNEFVKSMLDEDDTLGLANTYAEDYTISMGNIAELQHQLRVLDKQGLSDADKKAKKEEILAKLMEEAKNAKEAQKAIDDQILQTHEKISAEYEKERGFYSDIIGFLEKEIELRKLVFGEDAVGADEMNAMYTEQATQQKNIVDSLETQRNKAYDRLLNNGWMNANGTLTEAGQQSEEARELWQEYYDLQKEYVDNSIKLAEIYKNIWVSSIESVIEEEKENIFGTNFDIVKDEWDWRTAQANKYFDALEKDYQRFTVEDMFDTAIQNASIENQARLNELKEKELDILDSKEKLTARDIDMAKKRLDVEKARIALEEAQSNKNSLRLMRGADGNYSYQYVTDPTAVAEAERQLREAQEAERAAAVQGAQSTANSTIDGALKFFDTLTSYATDGELTDDEQQLLTAQYQNTYEQSQETMNALGDWAKVYLGEDKYRTDDGSFDLEAFLEKATDTEKALLTDSTGLTTSALTILKQLMGTGGNFDFSDITNKGSLTEVLAAQGFSEDEIDAMFANATGLSSAGAQNAEKQREILENQLTTLKAVAETLLGLDTAVKDIAAHLTGNGYEESNWKYNEETGKFERAQAASGALLPEWGTEGRKMWVHQNELILNAVDTNILLKTLDIVKSQMAQNVGATQASMLNGLSLSEAVWELAKEMQIEQNINIQANFPNAKDKGEIEAAFKELVGLATQHAFKSSRV